MDIKSNNLMRKFLFGSLLIGMIAFLLFAAVGTPGARAQDGGTETPTNATENIQSLVNEDPFTSSENFSWSPTENTLLYWSLNSEKGGPGLRPNDLNLYNATTRQSYILAKDGYGGLTNFSSDGSTLSFWYDNFPYIINFQEDVISAGKVVTEHNLIKGSFSINNEYLIYVTDSDEVYVRHLKSNLEIRLGVFEGISAFPFLSPAWSPENKWVAFNTESKGILIDPMGINDPVILTNLTLPQSEYSAASPFFIWSDGGKSLYTQAGNLIYSLSSDIEPVSTTNYSQFSFDKSYRSYHVNGELLVENMSSGETIQLTSNSLLAEQLVASALQSETHTDVVIQAVADGFDYPVGKPNGSGYNPPSTPIAGCEYLQSTNGCGPLHPGIDFNGNGGGDSDLGNPVYAVANGTVVFSGTGSGNWGNIILIEHSLPDGRKVWSQYAHLQIRNVASGVNVNKGDQIGTIGKGNNNVYYAHLHFEIRTQSLAADFWPPNSGWPSSQVQQYYTNPVDYINGHRVISVSCNNPSPNSDQVGIYSEDNYCGAYKILGIGDYSNPAALGVANDSISSIKVGGNVKATLCKDDNYGGGCEDFTGDDPSLGNNSIGNDSASSAKVTSRSIGNPLPSDYGFCAEEGQTCAFSGNGQIYFGANNQFVGPVSKTDGVACNNNVFGDPISGTHKQCFIKGGRPQGSIFCANEGGTCGFGSSNVATVYYGVNGKYNTHTGVVSSTACDNGTFGDPFSGLGKACYYSITGSTISAPSNPSPADNITFARTNNTVLSWSTNGSSCTIHIWGGSIDISPSNGCGSLTFGAQRGGAYNWQVVASNGSGSSTGPIWHFNVKPYGPTNLSINSPLATQLTLNWSLSADEPSDIDSYQIYQNDLFLGVAPKGATSFPITDLNCANSYSFFVKSIRQGVLSDPSNTVTRGVVSCPPDKPSNLIVSNATTTSLTLSWQDNSNNETGFNIYRWGYDGTKWTFIYLDKVGANGTSYTQNELYCGNDFNYYEVSAFNDFGESMHAGWVQGTTSECPLTVNDDFDSPKTISQLTYSDTMETSGATSASDDPVAPACSPAPGLASVWYQYTPAVNTAVYLDTFGSSYDTYIAVWTGSRGSLSAVGCNDDFNHAGGILQSGLQVNLTGGTTYFIEIAEWNGGSAAGLSTSSVPSGETQTGTSLPISKPGSDVSVQAGGTLVFHVSYALEITSWYGGVAISSDQNVIAVGRPHIGSEVTSYDGFSTGSTTMYVPMLFKQMWGSYDSALYIQNTNPSNSANVTIKFYDANGVLSCTKTDTIPKLSSHGYWLPDETCLPASWAGGVVITADRNIVAVGRPHISGQVMTYNGFSSGSATMYVPMLFKQMWGYDSAFYVQNTDPSISANVTIKFYDSNGILSCTKSDTIPKLASHGYWLPSETCLPASWAGGVVVTADRAIVAVGRPHIGSEITTYNGFAAGSTAMYAPMLFKRAYGSYDSALYVQNVHTSLTANVTLKFYDPGGNLTCSVTDSILSGASKGYWLPSLSCLPNGWSGSIKVESNQPVVAIARAHLGSSITAYDGFPAGGTAASVPMLFKQMWGSYDSALYVENTNASSTANLTINFYDVNGYLSCVRTDTIPALGVLSYWLPSMTCSP
jgi:murein DD-endopeptidase MepM/ murein hydrolase activator NlpD